MIYQILAGQTVINTITADAEFMAAQYPDGNYVEVAPTPEPPAIPTVPRAVTMRQARLALLGAGLLDAVAVAIAGAGPVASIEWQYAQEVQRSAGLVPQMATALGMTDAQIDALFIAAAAL